MQWLYGTGNPAKLKQMRHWLADTPVTFIGLAEASLTNIPIQESGRDPLDNARIKAQAYFEAARMPTFSCDTGLYLTGIPDDLQPGVHVRRVGDRSLSDEEMIAYYGGLAHDMGGRILAQYKNAIALCWADGHMVSAMVDDMSSAPFYLVEKPHSPIRPGFPLDSLSIATIDATDPWAASHESQARAFRTMFAQAMARMHEEGFSCA